MLTSSANGTLQSLEITMHVAPKQVDRTLTLYCISLPIFTVML